MTILDFVRNNGIKQKYIAQCCNLSKDAVRSRLQGKTEWDVKDLPGLSQALRLRKEQLMEMILEEKRYGNQG